MGCVSSIRAPRSPHLFSPPQRTPQPGPPPAALVSPQHRDPCPCPVSFPRPSRGESTPFPWQGRQKSRVPAEIPTSRGAGGVPASPGHCLHCASALPFPRGEPGRISLLPKEFCSAKGRGFWVVFPTPRLMAGVKQSHMSHFGHREDQTLQIYWG